jgi:hypothetical protein
MPTNTLLYNQSAWRARSRTGTCRVAELIGGECRGELSLHHVYPLSLGGPEDGRTVLVCARHHPMLEALARRVYGAKRWRRCPHQHRTVEARRECEERLNRPLLV